MKIFFFLFCVSSADDLHRLCKVLIGGCFDDYQIIPVPELAADVDWSNKNESLTLSFACNHTWVSSDKYLITIQSTTTSFRAQSDKFEVRNSKGTVTITQPAAAGATVAYYTPFTVKWKTTNTAITSNGTSVGFVVSLVSKESGNELFTSEVTAANELQIVLQESDAPVGAYELRVVEASNRDVATKVDVKVAQPTASLRVLEPILSSVWTTNTPASIAWTATNVRGNVHVELYNGQGPVQSLGNSTSGTLDVPLVPEVRSGFAYQVRLSGVGPAGEEIETFSAYFQLRGPDSVDPAGLCVVASTDTRLAVCKDPRGRPLLNYGGFALFEMRFLWQTCVSLVGTALDVSVKYTYYSVPDTDVLDDKNFLPNDSDRDMAVLDGKSSPHSLIVRMRNVVKGTKQTTPPPGSWEFSTDLYITPFTAANATAVLLATGLKFVAVNPDCKNQTIATAPTRCDPATRAQTKCVVPPPDKQRLFAAGTKLCSSFQIGALEKPCGESVVFSKTRASETLTATSGLGEPCGGTFYVEVSNGRQTGFVPSSTVGTCAPPKPASQTIAASSLSLPTLVAIAASAVWLI